MAEFTKLENEFLPKDSEWIKLSGEITEEDITKINSLIKRTTIVIDNTKSITSEMLSKISSNVVFSVVGGLDYFNKKKFQDKAYINRTLTSPLGLCEIVKYYESIEKEMLPEWNDT